MTQSPEAYLDAVLSAPAPAAAQTIADALAARYPGAAVFLYGSGISVSANEDPTAILFDYYVVAPDYRAAIPGFLERIAARSLPPNVYYVETQSAAGLLRAKYALLSVDAFERLVGKRAFHSYFWARFAQPSRLVVCPPALKSQMIAGVKTALAAFLQYSQGLVDASNDWQAVWAAGLDASYRAELRAEAAGRATKLIQSYGDWPRRVAAFSLDPAARRSRGAEFAWRTRALYGAVLSVARLLKATTTFKGGLDYIAWKVKRHAGVDVAVKPWERRHPFIAAPVVALRYYRMRAAARKAAGV